MNKLRAKNGFTLVEMIVSLGLFTIIMFIATSAFLSIVNTDRKARAVRIAVDNLNIALEDMSRRIKTGLAYDCGGNINTATTTVADCASGIDLALTDQTGTRTVYQFNAINKSIERQIFGEPSPTRVTSPEISIDSLKFVVSGSNPSPDIKQPMVTIVIDGSLGSGPTTSGFKIQTTVTQRAYDN